MKKTAITALFATMSLFSLLASSCSNNSTNPGGSSTPTPPSYSLGVTFGLSGAATMSNPVAVAYSGNHLWVTSNYNESLQEWTTGGVGVTQITTFGAAQTFSYVWGVAAGPDGYIYAADAHQVEEFDPTGAYVAEFGSTEVGSNFVYGVAVDSNYAYLTEDVTQDVLRYTISGIGSGKTFTSPLTFIAAAGPMTLNTGLCALDTGGNFFVAGTGGPVAKYDPSGAYQMTVTQSAATNGVAVDGSGNIFIAQTGPGITPTPSLNQYDPSGNFVRSYGAGILQSPYGVALDGSGNLYVTDRVLNVIQVFNKN